jgi:hypothetical protein
MSATRRPYSTMLAPDSSFHRFLIIPNMMLSPGLLAS